MSNLYTLNYFAIKWRNANTTVTVYILFQHMWYDVRKLLLNFTWSVKIVKSTKNLLSFSINYPKIAKMRVMRVKWWKNFAGSKSMEVCVEIYTSVTN